jgi:hypothetical protein
MYFHENYISNEHLKIIKKIPLTIQPNTNLYPFPSYAYVNGFPQIDY